MIRDRTDQSGDWDVTHEYDRRDERPSEVVVRAVAGTTNQPICSIDPLYDAIEPDALNAFIEDGDATTWITFSYGGCLVHVDEDSVAVVRTDDREADDRR